MSRRCKNSWIDSYLEYTSVQESPTAFHKWVGISIISATLARSVWIPRIKYTIYPNLYVILVAGSAKCKKSTAIAIGMDLLRNIEEPPMIFAQKITTEALIQALEESKKGGNCEGIIVSSELSVFMGADAIRSGIIPALTDIYDSPKEWVYHTRGRGKEVLHNVTLGFLGASTKDWLKSSIPADAVGGGFTSRIIFIYQEQPAKLILFDEPRSNETTLKTELIRDLSHIRANIKGSVSFSDKAKAVAVEWYHKSNSIVHDSKLDGYFGRKHDTMFKLALCLSVAEGDSLIIDEYHIKKALFMMEDNERHLEGLMNSIMATTTGEMIDRVLRMIKKYPRIQHSDLLRKCWRFADSEAMQKILNTLMESRDISCTMATDGRTRIYKPYKKS